MDFVWIYVKSQSYWHKSGIWNELEYSIKSVKKNYKGHCRCIVVGDDPELDVIHLPVERLESSKYGYYRHFDMIKKVKTYLNWTETTEFVLMYDDIYLLQPTIKLELKKIYAKKQITSINEYLEERKGDSGYVRCWESTYNRIQEYRDDLWDWETHLPRYYNIKRLNSIIDSFNLEKVAYLAFSLYASKYGGTPDVLTDDIQSDVVVYQPTKTNYEKDFSAKFMNVSDDGITSEVRKRMSKLFD
jgi:hypothetical protein